MKFYCETKEQVLQKMQSSEKGLTSAEAQKRLDANGKNRLDAAPGKSLIRRFLEQLADPMIIRVFRRKWRRYSGTYQRGTAF